MGLAILVLFLVAWAVVLGGPMLARALRNRRDEDPVGGFGTFGRLGGDVRPRRKRFGGWWPKPGVDLPPEVPSLRVPVGQPPVEPEVVEIGSGHGRVPAAIRRRRALLTLVCAAGALLLLAVATGSLVVWILQIALDVLLVAYGYALSRQGRERTTEPLAKATARDPDATAFLGDTFRSAAGAPDDDVDGIIRPRTLRLPSRRVVLSAAAVIAAGCLVFGAAVMLGGRGERSESAANPGGDETSRDQPSATSAKREVTTTIATTTTTLPPTTLPVTTVASAAPPRATVPPRPLAPVTQPPVVLVPAPAPPTTQPPPPPPAPQNTSLLCILLKLC